jgi:predicted secreted acid phosphatase
MSSPIDLKSRQEWLDACQFHDVSQREILDLVAEGVKKTQGKKPLVLLDLDSTLYEVQPRTHAIIQDWLRSENEHVRSVSKLEKLKHSELGYSLKDTFKTAGLNLEESSIQKAWEHLKDFWWKHFFSNLYLKHDKAYPGAVEYVKRLYDLGAHLVYLTGRDEPRMGEGTRANLKRDGFPIALDRTHLLLKKHEDLEDLAHKKDVIHFIEERGSLVASFENEPQNFTALMELFPDALHVFVETVSSDSPAKPVCGAYRIRGWRSETT